jgi:benzylsuccinate CoA-transferase BbsE subunit
MSESLPGMPLAGRPVVDLTGTRGAYAARLLGDLGADVIRVEPPGLPGPVPAHLTPGSARRLFANLSKTIRVLDLLTAAGRSELDVLLRSADLVVTDWSPAGLRSRGLQDLSSRFPRLVHLSISPWGLTGPDQDRPASDLTVLAAGGLLSLAGDPDRAPVRPYPEQSSVAASLHGVVGALIALLARDREYLPDVSGQLVDVSAQEAVAHSLENAVQYVDLEGVVRTRVGSRPAEAGSGLFRCLDGYVYLVAGLGGLPLAWEGLLEWLRGEGDADLADELGAARWAEQAWRRTGPAVEEFQQLFEHFAQGKTKDALCRGGQAHGVSISPVSTVQDLLTNEQLVERGFFRRLKVAGGEVTVPGAPYRFAGAEVGPRATQGR